MKKGKASVAYVKAKQTNSMPTEKAHHPRFHHPKTVNF
jgi:hypothetical protein